jgi:hypothetical protein
MNKAPSVKETAIIKQSRLLVSNFHFDRGKPVYYTYISSLVKHYMESPTFKNQQKYLKGIGYKYDGNVFVAWVLQVRRAEVVTK